MATIPASHEPDSSTTPGPTSAPERRCGSCTHWGGRVSHWNTIVHRTCGCPQILHGNLIADAITDPTSAVAETYQGWGLLTGPQFGCVHWQAGPQQPSPHAQVMTDIATMSAPMPSATPVEETPDA